MGKWLIVKGAFMTSIWLIEEKPLPNNNVIESP